MERQLLISDFTEKDGEFVNNMNNLSEEEQRKLLLQRAKDFSWEIYENKRGIHDKSKRNFHVIINNEKDLRIQRDEYSDYLRRKIIKWSLWNKRHRIEGAYGELVYQMIKLANMK